MLNSSHYFKPIKPIHYPSKPENKFIGKKRKRDGLDGLYKLDHTEPGPHIEKDCLTLENLKIIK